MAMVARVEIRHICTINLTISPVLPLQVCPTAAT